MAGALFSTKRMSAAHDAETEFSNAIVAPPDAVDTQGQVDAIAKAIGDLDDLVRLLRRGLPLLKAWQRQLAAQLGEIDRLMQVFRMTVAMERSDTEIGEAAAALCTTCRQTASVVFGSRADATTKATVRLMAGLASSVSDVLGRASAVAMAANLPPRPKAPASR